MAKLNVSTRDDDDDNDDGKDDDELLMINCNQGQNLCRT